MSREPAPAAPGRRRLRRLLFAATVLSLLVETVVVARRRGSVLAVDTVVRCSEGHLFTTWWIPGGSLKAVRLGWWRYQRCPVCGHWRLVTPATVGELGPEELARAAAVHDLPIP